MRVAAEIVLTGEQRSELDRFARGRRTAARLGLRARIVLLAADGHTDLEIAQRLGVVPRTAARWRARFLKEGVAGLERDAPRPGRRPAISPQTVLAVIEKTTQQKPSQRTHWSTRTMARSVGISEASVRRIWRAHGLKPHRVHPFKLSNDPRFAEKLEDVVCLYLNPPEHALVLSLDEKSQIQALDRTQPGLPMKKGRAQTMTHDYKRYGTTTLFAALNTLDGTVMATCMERHRHQEWLKFLRLIDAGEATSSHRRQLRHAQASRRAAMGRTPSPLPLPLHPHLQQLAQHGRALLPRPDRKPTPARRLHQR